MAIVSITELLQSGVHFGHSASRWNPKMAPYIFGKRNLIHIVDLKETILGIIKAYGVVSNMVAQGETILFVGTKRQARTTIEAEAKRCGMPYVSERWLGGMLTNFRTIRSRLRRLKEVEDLEETNQLSAFSKKMVARITRERRKIERNLSGVRSMERLPGALFVVDPRHELNAVKEARKLEIPIISLIDTDSSPDWVDIPIPGNDDAVRSIMVVCSRMADAVLDGKSRRAGALGIETAPLPEPPPALTPPAVSESRPSDSPPPVAETTPPPSSGSNDTPPSVDPAPREPQSPA